MKARRHAQELSEGDLGFPGIVEGECLREKLAGEDFGIEPLGDLVFKLLEHDATGDTREALARRGHIRVAHPARTPRVVLRDQPAAPDDHQARVGATALALLPRLLQPRLVHTRALPQRLRILESSPAPGTIRRRKVVIHAAIVPKICYPNRQENSRMPALLEKTKTYRRFPPERMIGTMSLEEWIAYLESSQHKSNYICGEVVEVAGASPEHNQIAMNVGRALGNALEAQDANCDVLGSDQKVYMAPGLYYFPDLCVVCGEWKVDLYDALQNPCVIVEVLSPSTEADDRTDKFREYQQIASLRHYILIDQSRVAVTHFEKLAQGLWAIVGDFRALDDTLKITLGAAIAEVPLKQVYRRVAFPETT